MMTKITIVLMLSVMSVRAYAAPVVLDFTSVTYGAGYGAQTFSMVDQGVGVTLQAQNATETPVGALWWDNLDGFGVMGSGYSLDEIEGDERLWLRFTEAQTVIGFNLTDLFIEQEPNNAVLCPSPGCYVEWGAVQFVYEGGARSLFHLVNGVQSRNLNGVLDVAVHETNVIGMIFLAPGIIQNGTTEYHEFSLAGVRVDVQAVPEPGTLLLFASGLVAIVARRRQGRTLPTLSEG